MNAQQKLLWVFGGIVALLALASLVGWALQRLKGRTEVVANLNSRVRAWWGMVAVLAVCFWLGPVANLVVFAFISFFALREFITLTPTRPGDHLPLVVAFYVLIPVQYWLIGDDWYGLFSIFIPVYAFLALPALAVFGGDGRQDRVEEARQGSGRQRRPRLRRRNSRHRPCGRDFERNRLSGDDEGQRRRRRQGHAPRLWREGRPRGLRERQARGAEQLRRRPGVHREIHPQSAPYRDPDPRRPARQHPLSQRPRMQHPAPPPDGARGTAVALSPEALRVGTDGARTCNSRWGPAHKKQQR